MNQARITVNNMSIEGEIGQQATVTIEIVDPYYTRVAYQQFVIPFNTLVRSVIDASQAQLNKALNLDGEER
ncbi:hypothetical protein [Sulfobacillus sp. hq2]|uniref:hypothetical protein n=1 Tax=Sulfobacillus TaxID=28033 RepID=UPI000CD1748B|nr:hypothetical protein [Sulfobacillus sp. hq2]POB11442.1 hypothetical protein CO251_04675 [Sulfobacillus sp. hq2]